MLLLLGLVLPLCLDTFAVAAALGMTGLTGRERIRYGLLFAAFASHEDAEIDFGGDMILIRIDDGPVVTQKTGVSAGMSGRRRCAVRSPRNCGSERRTFRRSPRR